MIDSFRRGFNHREDWNAEADALGFHAAKIETAPFLVRVWVGLKWVVLDARDRLSEWIAT